MLSENSGSWSCHISQLPGFRALVYNGVRHQMLLCDTAPLRLGCGTAAAEHQSGLIKMLDV